MSDGAQLEREAAVRLGLAPAPGPDPLAGLPPHRAQAVRSYVAAHGAVCDCGRPGLRGAPCQGCGGELPQPGAPRRVRPGDRIGPLRLIGKLGAGAAGTVYRARHEDLACERAVKVCHAPPRDGRARARFEREAEALARLTHRAILNVHALHQLDGALAIELEFVEGQSLGERLQDGPLPWRQAASLTAEIARGIDHAHAHGVLHRDLKPDNVLLKADGQPLVADLGLTRLTDSTSSLTRSGTVLGTPCYMAPEALEGDHDDPTVDVYGLGAVLYAALTGHAPYQARSLPELFVAVHGGHCPPTGAPAALERVRLRAMAVDPSERYPSAAALADDLEAVLRGEAPAGGSRRRVVGALALLAALGGGAVAAVAANRPSGSSDPPASSPAPAATAPRQSSPDSLGERPCPGLHLVEVEGARRQRLAGDEDDAEARLRSVLSGAPCQAQALAKAELAALGVELGPVEPPRGVDPMWEREPSNEVIALYDIYRTEYRHDLAINSLSEDAVGRLAGEGQRTVEDLLLEILRSPPSRLHRTATLHLATVRRMHAVDGDLESALVCLARGALIGEARAALILGLAHFPGELDMVLGNNTEEFDCPPDLELALACFKIADRFAGVQRPRVTPALDAVRRAGYTLPPTASAIRSVWEAFPDAR